MHYIIYKITNKINDKFYIGMHKTNHIDDGYMGSGKLIKRAIKKYGLDNFTKEILHVFDNEQDMKNKEKELVIITENSYNLCPGGHGGFGYININKLNTAGQRKASILGGAAYSEKMKNDSNFYDKRREHLKTIGWSKTNPPPKGFLGKKHSEETKQKMKKTKNVGINNSQFGTCWITNGQENKKIKKEDIDIWMNQGYSKGRKIIIRQTKI